MVALVVEALFVAVFVRALVSYARTRDHVQRDVMLVFSAVAALLVVGLARQLFGEPPRLVGALASAWLLGQPFWTLRVAARLRPVPRWVLWAAAAGWAGTAAPVFLAGQVLPKPLVLAAVLAFVTSEAAAAVYLGAEARRRTGSSRKRLWLAAAGTGLFAAAIVVAGAGSAIAGHAELIGNVDQVLALGSAVGYLLAFMPPKTLRQTWSGRAAYALITELLAGPPGESPEAIWRRYATSVRLATAADAVVVLVPGADGTLVLGSCRGRDCGLDGLEPGGISGLLAVAGALDVTEPRRGQPVPPLAADLAARTHARYVTAVPLRPGVTRPGGRGADPGALVLLNHHRGLFEDDDAVLLGELAVQAAVLAEQGRVAAHMAAAAEAANSASKAKSEFLANMSHELRTPLNAIIGFSELMGGEETDGESRWVPNEWIEHIRTGGRHLLGLINDVLDLSKVEAGRIELFPEPLALPDVIGDAVATLGPLIRAHELELTVAVPPLSVAADPIRFRQIVDNLLSNAIKFTPEGGQIFIAAHRDGDRTHISVTDTGPGISAADQGRVFTEFTQVGDIGKRKSGTGLGLPLARRLAQAHGGDIEVESEPGHGTRFTITLPTGDTAPACEPDTGAPAVVRAGGVLVIEDDPAAALLLSTHLERAGYPVTVAATGEEGLAAARTCQPAVILLDLILPGIDGRRVLAQLKDDPWLRQIPVAIISVTDEREVGLALGAVDYFVKPVNHDSLLAWLAHHGFIPPLSDRTANVLVIDDDPATIAVVKQALARQGIGVAEAANGLDGLRLARAHPFDLIICDLLMPGLDGYTVIAALHDDPATEHTPVLVLTAQDLTAADRNRLDGKTLAIVSKGGTAVSDIHNWVERITELTTART